MAIRDRLRNQQFEAMLFSNRILMAGFVVFILVSTLLFRLYQLQYVGYGHYSGLSKNNRVRLMSVPPARGLIFDRNGVIIANNLPSFQLEITPEIVKDIPATIQALQQFIPISASEIKRFNRALKRKRRFEGIPLKFNLNDDQVAKISVNLHRFPGIAVEAHLSRHYPLKEQAAHTIGYVGRINEKDLKKIDTSNYSGTIHIGKTGVERYYENKLHGTVGYQQVEVNVEGRILHILDETPAIPGENLYLTLDIGLQGVAEKAMKNYSGSAVAIDPNNGEILALVSKPSYDPNLFVNGISTKAYNQLNKDTERPLFNRSISGQYPPGSTIKPIIALAGLEHKMIHASQKIVCKGHFTLPNDDRKYRDWKKTGHGLVNLTTSIAQSCDVYYYQLALKLTIDKMSSMLKKFGFGQRTGIDNIGEARGILPSREWKLKVKGRFWYPGETLITGIGQGYFTATPIQLAKATAMLATRGKLIQPHLLMKTENNEKQTLSSYPYGPVPVLKVASNKHWNSIEKAMRSVVHASNGTAKRIRSKRYTIAGKTGTAQVYTIAQNARYDKKNTTYKLRDHALFISYAPIKNPKIVVIVVAEHGGSGSGTAAPIAKKILDHYLLNTLKQDKI